MENTLKIFSKEDTQVGNKHVKKCSASLAIREIKTTMRGHFTLTRMSKIRKTDNNKC